MTTSPNLVNTQSIFTACNCIRYDTKSNQYLLQQLVHLLCDSLIKNGASIQHDLLAVSLQDHHVKKMMDIILDRMKKDNCNEYTYLQEADQDQYVTNDPFEDQNESKQSMDDKPNKIRSPPYNKPLPIFNIPSNNDVISMKQTQSSSYPERNIVHRAHIKQSKIYKKRVPNKELPPTPNKSDKATVDTLGNHDSESIINKHNNINVSMVQQNELSSNWIHSEHEQFIPNNNGNDYNDVGITMEQTQIGESYEIVNEQNRFKSGNQAMSQPNIGLTDSSFNHQNERINQQQYTHKAMSQPNIDAKNYKNARGSLEGVPIDKCLENNTIRNDNKSAPKHHDRKNQKQIIGQYPNDDSISNNEYDRICQEAFDEINKIRQNPQYLIPRLEDIKNNMKKENGIYSYHGRIYKEGPKVIENAIAALKQQKSVGSLMANQELAKAAIFTIENPSMLTANGHIPNLQNVRDAEQRDPNNRRMSTCGENIMYGVKNGRDIICALIIDDGVPNRGHRRNIFKNTFTEIGFAVGRIPQKGIMCVSDFSGYFKKSHIN